VAQASGERSQTQNRRVALARLQALVDARNAGTRVCARQQAWQEHNELERGQALLKFTGGVPPMLNDCRSILGSLASRRLVPLGPPHSVRCCSLELKARPTSKNSRQDAGEPSGE